MFAKTRGRSIRRAKKKSNYCHYRLKQAMPDGNHDKKTIMLKMAISSESLYQAYLRESKRVLVLEQQLKIARDFFLNVIKEVAS